MTEQERIRLLLDMQEHTENYTDAQLDQLLEDEDLSTLLEELALTKRALMRRELKREVHAQKTHTRPLPSGRGALRLAGNSERRLVRPTFLKAAASFIGVMLLSGIALAAIWSLSPESPSPIGEEDEYLQATDSATRHYTPLSDGRGVGGEVVIFAGTSLDTIATELANYYHKVADIQSERARDVRLYYKWHRGDSLATVMSDLNHFERVNISVEDDRLIVKP